MITSGQFDYYIIDQLSGWMSAQGVNMNVATTDGTNPDTLAVKAKAIRQCGGSVAALPAVSDADVATIVDPLDKLLDLAYYFQCERIMTRYAQYSITISSAGQQKDQFRQGIKSELERRAMVCLERWGYGLLEAPMQAGPALVRVPVGDQVATFDPATGAQVCPTAGPLIVEPSVPWGAVGPFGASEGWGP